MQKLCSQHHCSQQKHHVLPITQKMMRLAHKYEIRSTVKRSWEVGGGGSKAIENRSSKAQSKQGKGGICYYREQGKQLAT